ncbi:electron transfer flavoprotein subunit beta/FixA family protein [Halomicrobium mukohataei]|uniref:Electron transfer flavoprotein subunit beta/FixA family protein n=1 Tax=Halomicrobium mukohataei TaxID=57705 RepID=A0A847TY82_9EURY|nr:electron transfer flavoprotein subunit beta/FixA family protein [Halomicrobium mukohataei]NLV10942.1 electron transfer flavoprotein subunit beta/FixA family protein [Halomicrobium mukohataei]
MHTVVLTKGVPDFREGQVSFDEDGHLERGKTPTVMNPNDKHALRAALQTKVRNGGTVSLLSMGPPGYKEVLQEGMADVYADDLFLLSDREMGAADTWATAMTVATGIEKLDAEPDLIFAGFKTADGETGHTGPQTAWCLEMPTITHVVALDIDEDEGSLRAKRLVEGDVSEIETVETDLPAFVVADPEFEPTYRKAAHRLRWKDLRAATQERAANLDLDEDVTVWDHEDLNLDPDYIGLDGSPTIVAGVDPIPKAPAEREATLVDGVDDEAGMEQVYDELAAYAAGD